MVKINGVKANETSQMEKVVLPSMNEVLDRMENNFESRKIDYSKSGSNNFFGDFDIKKNNQNLNGDNQKVNTLGSFDMSQNSSDNSSFLLTVLPMLFSKDKNINFKNAQNEIIKNLLKKTNNPLLIKIFELMPKLEKMTNTEKKTTTFEEKKEKNIDDFVKAEDYQSKEE